MQLQYYFAPQSPWTYLGHDRFCTLLSQAGATVEVLPTDYGRVFPLSGGLPLPKRAPQRQAYRLVELKRFREHLRLPLTLQPKHFPVAAEPSARLIIATELADGPAAALRLTGAVLRAVWVEERDIADAPTLAALLAEQNLPGARLQESASAAVQARYDQNTQRAIDAGVFGAPTYVVDGELFWGQDRLEFLARRLGLRV